jgi:hypothetical protein
MNIFGRSSAFGAALLIGYAAVAFPTAANAARTVKECVAQGGGTTLDCLCQSVLESGSEKALLTFLSRHPSADTICNAVASTAYTSERGGNDRGGRTSRSSGPDGPGPGGPGGPGDPSDPDSPGRGKGGKKGNNGWGNGDQDAPGNSAGSNNAENSSKGSPPGKGGDSSPPGQGGTPPGQDGGNPPGQDGNPPGKNK